MDDELLICKVYEQHRKRNISWHNNWIHAKPTVPGYVQKQNDDLMKLKEEIKNPEYCIRLFWTDKWVDEVCEQSKLYAAQISLSSDNVTKENLILFMTILVISGYNRLPTRRLYWCESPDVFNLFISESMRRDMFEEIMRCLHFAHNMKIREDKFYKVRI
ncbi:PiggyBac transposable element-derived protein 3 [Portunus trituberculatus]|uniref:PiggyBac transposable element-derived protein 3 n=1 Tax=Portunus trituberculatus TaxID=210409 RepID=A0A5B7FLX7_PORTR|nr:PiggyBac transposable element-derived protein 3 [Portunus trituberculatus]